MLFHALIATILVLSQSLTPKWEYQFEKKGVKVYTKEVEGSGLKAFKGETTFNISSEQLIEKIFDIENYPKWCFRTTSTRLIRTENKKVYYRYVSATPPMIKNREAYMCNTLLPQDLDSTIVIQIGTFLSNEPIPSGFIRMPFSTGSWKLKPLSEQKTLVTFEMQADPGGLIPSWLANMAASDAPWISMTNLQQLILNEGTKP